MKLAGLTIILFHLFCLNAFAGSGKLRIPFVANDAAMDIDTLEKHKEWDDGLKQHIWVKEPVGYSENNQLHIRTLYHGTHSFLLSSSEEASRAASYVNAGASVNCVPNKEVKNTCQSLFIAGHSFAIEKVIVDDSTSASINDTQRSCGKDLPDESVKTSKKSSKTSSQ